MGAGLDTGVEVKRLRLVTIVLPIGYILAIEVFSLLVLLPLTGGNAVLRVLLIFALLVIGVVPFSFWVFATIERRMRELAQANEAIRRRNQELATVNRAITSISGALDLPDVLQNIADAARELVRARYAALGVADERGRMASFITSGITPEQRAKIGPLPQGHGLLGALIKEAKPLRIPDIAQDPRSHGFPPNHPPMTSLLGVPVLFNGQPVGDLYLTDKIGADAFSQEDQDLLMLLANHAAVAIENARLYEEVRSARDRLQAWSEVLEDKVAERTRQIQEYNREMTTRVLEAQENERKRISRELHDETAQSLSTLLITLDLLQQQVPEEQTQLIGGIERARSLARRILDETRALSHDLRPTILDDVGLAAAIEWYGSEWTKTFGVPIEIHADEIPPERVPPGTDIALFRITQEALNNAGKYAGASHVSVDLSQTDGVATLAVEDDGCGFDLDRVQGPTRTGGLGLYGMRERADLLGGTLSIDSTPNRGTRVGVAVPLRTDAIVSAELEGEIDR